MMNQIVSLAIPFIVLVIFGTMVDRITIFLEQIMKPIPCLPDQLESKLAFAILVVIGFGTCWEFDFNIFAYLNHPGRHEEAGYAFTAVLIAGGSAYLKQNFENIDSIPNLVSGLTGTIKKYVQRPTPQPNSNPLPVNPQLPKKPEDI